MGFKLKDSLSHLFESFIRLRSFQLKSRGIVFKGAKRFLPNFFSGFSFQNSGSEG